MPDSTYHVVELIGSSHVSWELAAHKAVLAASTMYRDLRVADVVQMNAFIENGNIVAFRANMRLSDKRTA